MFEGLFQPMHLLVIFRNCPARLRSQETSRTWQRDRRGHSGFKSAMKEQAEAAAITVNNHNVRIKSRSALAQNICWCFCWGSCYSDPSRYTPRQSSTRSPAVSTPTSRPSVTPSQAQTSIRLAKSLMIPGAQRIMKMRLCGINNLRPFSRELSDVAARAASNLPTRGRYETRCNTLWWDKPCSSRVAARSEGPAQQPQTREPGLRSASVSPAVPRASCPRK
jgi:hypothetical protein